MGTDPNPSRHGQNIKKATTQESFCENNDKVIVKGGVTM
jgi:hypothetical protein